MISVLPAMAMAGEVCDTTIVLDGKSFVLTDSLGITKVQVYRPSGDAMTKSYECEFVDGQEIERVYISSIFFPNKRKVHFRATLPVFFAGVGMMSEGVADRAHHKNLHANNSRSWEIGFTFVSLCQPFNKANTFGLVAGVQWKQANMHLDDDYLLHKSGQFMPYGGVNLKKNYLRYMSFNLPVLLETQMKIGRSNGFAGLGMSLEWRNRLTAKYITEKVGDEFVTGKSKIPVKHWGVNAELHVGYKSFMLYFRQALTPLYELTNGTKAYPSFLGVGVKF